MTEHTSPVSKEGLLSLEEGVVCEKDKKSNRVTHFRIVRVLKLILLMNGIIFLGWAGYIFWQNSHPFERDIVVDYEEMPTMTQGSDAESEVTSNIDYRENSWLISNDFETSTMKTWVDWNSFVVGGKTEASSQDASTEHQMPEHLSELPRVINESESIGADAIESSTEKLETELNEEEVKIIELINQIFKHLFEDSTTEDSKDQVEVTTRMEEPEEKLISITDSYPYHSKETTSEVQIIVETTTVKATEEITENNYDVINEYDMYDDYIDDYYVDGEHWKGTPALSEVAMTDKEDVSDSGKVQTSLGASTVKEDHESKERLIDDMSKYDDYSANDYEEEILRKVRAVNSEISRNEYAEDRVEKVMQEVPEGDAVEKVQDLPGYILQSTKKRPTTESIVNEVGAEVLNDKSSPVYEVLTFEDLRKEYYRRMETFIEYIDSILEDSIKCKEHDRLQTRIKCMEYMQELSMLKKGLKKKSDDMARFFNDFLEQKYRNNEVSLSTLLEKLRKSDNDNKRVTEKAQDFDVMQKSFPGSNYENCLPFESNVDVAEKTIHQNYLKNLLRGLRRIPNPWSSSYVDTDNQSGRRNDNDIKEAIITYLKEFEKIFETYSSVEDNISREFIVQPAMWPRKFEGCVEDDERSHGNFVTMGFRKRSIEDGLRNRLLPDEESIDTLNPAFPKGTNQAWQKMEQNSDTIHQDVESNLKKFYEKMDAFSAHIDRLHYRYLLKNTLNDDYVSQEFPAESGDSEIA